MARAGSSRSGSRGRGRRGGSRAQGRAGAPPAGAVDAPLPAGPQLDDPEFAAVPVTEIFDFLNRHPSKANFDDAALLFAYRERRLQDEIRIAEENEAAVRAMNRALRLDRRAGDARPRRGSGGVRGRGRGVAKQAGRGREPVPQGSVTASNDGVVGLDTGVQAMVAEGEVGHDAPRMRYRPSSLRMNATNAPVLGSALQAFGDGDDMPRKRRRAPRARAASALPGSARKKAKVTGDGVGSNIPRKSLYKANRMRATSPAALEEDSEDGGESSQN